MSKERCEAVKALMRQALDIMDTDKKACGDGRGIRLAVTYLEDAFMRMDFHMRENGWAGDAAPKLNGQSPAAGGPVMVREIPRVNKSVLAPAAAIPQLKTGLMTPAPTTPRATPRDVDEVLEDISLLG